MIYFKNNSNTIFTQVINDECSVQVNKNVVKYNIRTYGNNFIPKPVIKILRNGSIPYLDIEITEDEYKQNTKFDY